MRIGHRWKLPEIMSFRRPISKNQKKMVSSMNSLFNQRPDRAVNHLHFRYHSTKRPGMVLTLNLGLRVADGLSNIGIQYDSTGGQVVTSKRF